ncbi:MAG: cytochrome c biogenesis protein CcsA [Phycisphaerales bacterium]|nr:MAG: cytochrome c biogenesis protein CcsA [Phycisphaerales bacterium]
MLHTEILLLWAAIFAYVAAFFIHILGFIACKAAGARYAVFTLWISLGLHTATVIVRWIAGGHPPVTDTYELNLTGTWITVLVFLIFERLRKADRAIALLVTPAAFLVLGYGLMSRVEAVPMGPAYRSPWLAVHVIFAWLAFGCYIISTGAAMLLLLRARLTAARPALKIPGSETLDIASYRFIVLGFVNHAVMLVSGAVWAKNLWGHYWSWDPLETWSLIAFLFYAFYLHSRAFLGWRLRPAAYLALVGLILLAISFWGVGWFAPSVHPGP